MGMTKYVVFLLALLLVACVPLSPEQVPAENESAPQVTVPPTIPVAPRPVEVSPTAEELGIKSAGGKVSFLSPMMMPGQTATYRVSVKEDGPAVTYVRSYEVISYYLHSDPCVGIQRNSTVPGEQTTQTVWCDDVKYVSVWNDRRNAFSSPQVLGRDSRWEEESVQGFSVSDPAYEGAEKVVVPAGSFWTLHKSVFDGVVHTDMWASPKVPGFEAGLVKRVVNENGKVTTTELISFSGLEN